MAHIGDVPTLAAAVNFAWYALGGAGCILAKIDNDVEPPDDWEDEIERCCQVASLAGFLAAGEPLTPPVSLDRRVMRRPHVSQRWGSPFIYGRFTWLSPELASQLRFHDERFVRSTDGELGERANRAPHTALAYSHGHFCTHLLPRGCSSTEPEDIVKVMYEVTNRLFHQLPSRSLWQPTIWEDVLSRDAARTLLRSGGALPRDLEVIARVRLREKLDAVYAPLGAADLVTWLFDRSSAQRGTWHGVVP